MSRELLLLRHGKSDWSVDVDDFHRPLKDRGKRGAQQIGTWLAKNDLQPDRVISSPAERAINTAEKAIKAMGASARDIVRDQRIYEAGVGALLRVLADVPAEHRRVMLVGHNPGFENLLIHLVGDAVSIPPDGKLLPTATIARVALPDRWDGLEKGCGELVSITRARDLPEKFPYPDARGTEMRDRPAYYYTQSSVIPFRVVGQALEIVLVSSSSQKHFVVPKGIADPGITPAESAAQEALEEAGVEGEVLTPSLGHYEYEKWGAVCRVEVFPMRVTRELSEAAWEERHRGRRWVSAAEAERLIRQEAVKPMIRALAERFTPPVSV